MNIYDIAEQCGVSIATVSRVLNGSPNVSEKSRAKILAVMEEQGYQPNAFARGLGLGTMKMVGLLCADVSDPFYAKAVSLLESGLRDRGYDLLLYCTGHELSEKKKYLELLLAKNVDAIVLIGSIFAELSDNSHIEAAAKQVPVVIINGLIDVPDVYCVVSDEREAFSKVVRLLYRQGARRLLYLFDILTYSGRNKLEGFRDGLAACGLADGRILQVPRSLEDAEAAAEALLAGGETFDAVVCSEDLFAVAAQKALSKHGLARPVVGCNNSILAACATPSLTSVDFLLETMCETAMNDLNALLDGKAVPNQVKISSRLIERESFMIAGKDLDE